MGFLEDGVDDLCVVVGRGDCVRKGRGFFLRDDWGVGGGKAALCTYLGRMVCHGEESVGRPGPEAVFRRTESTCCVCGLGTRERDGQFV